MALLLLFVSACENAEVDGEELAAADSVETAGEPPEPENGYRVILEGSLADTLRGPARFGRVVDTRTQKERLVIDLALQTNAVSGIWLARERTERPPVGTYRLVSRSDTSALREGAFRLTYREGLLRVLHARRGEITIERSTDSLLVGRFRAELEGQIGQLKQSLRDEVEQNGVVQMEGQFEARDESPGFLVGL